MTRHCLADGCERVLYHDNTSGVCRAHRHTVHCLCVKCAGEDPARADARAIYHATIPRENGAKLRAVVEVALEAARRDDVCYELPSDDAPIADWMRPLSAMVPNRRNAYSTTQGEAL